MRTQVTFQHPAALVPLSPEDNVLSVVGAEWFLALLKSMTGWTVDPKLCQEDWGVVVFITRAKKKFWIGLGDLPDVGWLAHVHHGSFSWLQKFTASGDAELESLVMDLHRTLISNSEVASVRWYETDDKMFERGTARPDK